MSMEQVGYHHWPKVEQYEHQYVGGLPPLEAVHSSHFQPRYIALEETLQPR